MTKEEHTQKCGEEWNVCLPQQAFQLCHIGNGADGQMLTHQGCSIQVSQFIKTVAFKWIVKGK